MKKSNLSENEVRKSIDISKDEQECPLLLARRMVMGKYKLSILWFLARYDHMRFGELKNGFEDPKLSQKMLTQHLRELEVDRLINRKSYNEVPPRVEYSLTELGKSFIPVMNDMEQWANKYIHFMMTEETAPK